MFLRVGEFKAAAEAHPAKTTLCFPVIPVLCICRRSNTLLTEARNVKRLHVWQGNGRMCPISPGGPASPTSTTTISNTAANAVRESIGVRTNADARTTSGKNHGDVTIFRQKSGDFSSSTAMPDLASNVSLTKGHVATDIADVTRAETVTDKAATSTPNSEAKTDWKNRQTDTRNAAVAEQPFVFSDDNDSDHDGDENELGNVLSFVASERARLACTHGECTVGAAEAKGSRNSDSFAGGDGNQTARGVETAVQDSGSSRGAGAREKNEGKLSRSTPISMSADRLDKSETTLLQQIYDVKKDASSSPPPEKRGTELGLAKVGSSSPVTPPAGGGALWAPPDFGFSSEEEGDDISIPSAAEGSASPLDYTLSDSSSDESSVRVAENRDNDDRWCDG